MLVPLWRSIALMLAAMTPATPAVAADKPRPVHRIVAIGDLHGDFVAWRAIARAAGLVDGGGHWIGGATVLVQSGDVVDRGPDSLDIVRDLMRLQMEAPKARGRVVTLVGNHEAMNVTDDLRYVSPGDYAAFTNAGSAALRDRTFIANRDEIETEYRRRDPSMSADAIRRAWLAATPLGQIEHQRAWHPGGWIGRWVDHNPAITMIDGTIFVHGGVSAAYAKNSIADINRQVDAALAAGDTDPDSIINAGDGPLWYRGLVMRGTGDAASAPSVAGLTPEQELERVLATYGAKRMVIAHTPVLAGIAILDGGRLVRIDTGISEAFGGTLSYLEIVDGQLIPHAIPRPAASAAEAKPGGMT